MCSKAVFGGLVIGFRSMCSLSKRKRVHCYQCRSDRARAQSEIISRLARTLNTELVMDAGHRIEQEQAANPDARDLVLRARALNRQSTAEAGHREALNLLERALTLDPTLIYAKLLTAEMLVDDISSGYSVSADEDKIRVERLISEALEREPNSAYADAAKGLLR